MFFIILGTYTRWTFIIFSLVERILLLIFRCHTVTHGTDLRRSPLMRQDKDRQPIIPFIFLEWYSRLCEE